MKSLISKFFKDESGATAIEYGLIAAGIAIAIITAVNGVGSQLSTTFNNISSSLKYFRDDYVALLPAEERARLGRSLRLEPVGVAS